MEAKQTSPSFEPPLAEKIMAWGFWGLYHSVFFFLARWAYKHGNTGGDWTFWNMVGAFGVGAALGYFGWLRFQRKPKYKEDYLNSYTDILNFTFLMLTWFLVLFLFHWPPLPFLFLFWLVHTSLAPASWLTRNLLYYKASR